MSLFRHRTALLSAVVLVALAAAAAGVIGGASAGARTPRQIKTVTLLSLPPGSFELSLGTAPSWLPLSGKPETLTLIGGAPKSKHAADENAYIAFVDADKHCASTPAGAGSRTVIHELDDFYASSHSAGAHAGVFAPDGGAAKSSYIESVRDVVVRQSGSARACVWLTTATGATAKGKRARGSLVATLAVPLLNRTFAASVSNLTGASAGSGGYEMYAFDGGHAFTYSASTNQCSRISSDGAATVAAGTPGSENVSISADPCSTDSSTFRFSDGVSAKLVYPESDALATPPITAKLGACELDPLVGATVTQAEQYLAAVGCSIGRIEVSPYEKSLTRGTVSWASVDGGVAEIAPAETKVDLVLNGKP